MTILENKYNNISEIIRSNLKQIRSKLSKDEIYIGSKKIESLLLEWILSITNNINLKTANDKINLAGFWPLKYEPCLIDFLHICSSNQKLNICLPTIEKIDHALSFKLWTTKTVMKIGKFNILEPVSNKYLIPHILLIPTLGFTKNGDRIGYGKGYYDRTLSSLIENGHKFISIGISWECGLITDISYKAASHDITLDAILTTKGWEKEPTIKFK
ncbi:MAG: 5-formyltetrahydrofolate cyclo-ligase [Candidatus Kinetoplastibacterium crithidii]|nr:MAG: 5-formyltetrahydrofolate cyclo-ligase [Candidatus Kinetoplastibacterium crithidii]